MYFTFCVILATQTQNNLVSWFLGNYLLYFYVFYFLTQLTQIFLETFRNFIDAFF